MDENDSFDELFEGVTPIRRSNRVQLTPRPLSTRPRQQEADDRRVMDELLSDSELLAAEGVETGDELAHCGPGVQDRVYRKLRRGQYRVVDEIDLHGLRGAEAKRAVREFLNDCRARDLRCVRIVHGKGLGSTQRGPVLKQLVDVWLRRRDDVLAFHSCIPRHGGTGAVYVLLKRADGD